jgi:hypothetical protein
VRSGALAGPLDLPPTTPRLHGDLGKRRHVTGRHFRNVERRNAHFDGAVDLGNRNFTDIVTAEQGFEAGLGIGGKSGWSISRVLKISAR